MKKNLALLGASLLLLLATACGGPSAGGSAALTAGNTAAGQPASASPQDAETACTPVAGGIPASAEDFNCLKLMSASGSDSTGELAWLGSDPFTLVTLTQDGALRFASKTPCNTLMSSVKVTDTQFLVGPDMGMTQMGCQAPQSDYEKWVATFFSTPLDYTLNKDSLVLRGEHGTVTFKAAAA